MSNSGEGLSEVQGFIAFRRITSSMREMVNRRKDMVGSSSSEVADNFLDSNQDIIYSLIRIRSMYRQIHQKIEEKSKGVNAIKAKLETISNYYEGLVYQKNNIKREMLNCKNIQLSNLERVEELQPTLESLGKRTDLREIDLLDQVVDS